jgi:hypothetical protein
MLNQKIQLLRNEEEATVAQIVVIPLCFARCQKLIYLVLAGIEPQTLVSELSQPLRCNISFLSI